MYALLGSRLRQKMSQVKKKKNGKNFFFFFPILSTFIWTRRKMREGEMNEFFHEFPSLEINPEFGRQERDIFDSWIESETRSTSKEADFGVSVEAIKRFFFCFFSKMAEIFRGLKRQKIRKWRWGNRILSEWRFPFRERIYRFFSGRNGRKCRWIGMRQQRGKTKKFFPFSLNVFFFLSLFFFFGSTTFFC